MSKLVIKLRKFERYLPIMGVKEGTLKDGAMAVVETNRGIEVGQVMHMGQGCGKKVTKDIKLRKIIRYMTSDDEQKLQELTMAEDEAVKMSNQKAKEHEIPVRVVAAEYLFDRSKLYIYYRAAENKKGFTLKGFVKDLVGALKTKIDLSQLSARDEARMLSGIGPCGRVLCCASYLERPLHVTVKRVKELGLQISPTKTSGVCGKLMCCLQYEDRVPK
ncbi:MAG: regulatory iron-sulfur-containing complex subunit RicT [bacterium]